MRRLSEHVHVVTRAYQQPTMKEVWTKAAGFLMIGKRIFVADRIKALERLQVATIMFSGKFMRERRQVARAFLNAYVKGARFYNQYGPKSDEVIGVLTKHVRVTPADIRASMPFYLSPDGRPNVESLAAQQEWYAKMGMVKQKIPMERVVDLSLLQ